VALADHDPTLQCLSTPDIPHCLIMYADMRSAVLYSVPATSTEIDILCQIEPGFGFGRGRKYFC